MKARKRQAPGGLRRLRAPGAKKVCRRVEVAPGHNLRDLLMPGTRANVSAAEAVCCWDAAATCYSFNLNIALAAELISYVAYLAKCR